MIFQIHSDHGKHLAYNKLEAESNEKNGWKTVTEAEFYGLKATSEEFIPRGNLESAYIEKFGKKPHHKMKDETIKAALDGGNE